jgi:protein-disulfide isomerase
MTMDQALNVLATIAVLGVVGAAVSREVGTSATAADPMDPNAPTEMVENWEEIVRSGVPLGDPESRVLVAMFEDMQCPFCKHFHDSVLAPVLEAFPGDIAPVLVHFPLPNHAFALPAARAVECADHQKVASPMVDALYARQSHMGAMSWLEYAREARIPDENLFSECMSDGADVPRVARGTDLAQRMKVPGTPTVVVNGLRFSRPPSRARLLALVDSLLADSSLTPGG